MVYVIAVSALTHFSSTRRHWNQRASQSLLAREEDARLAARHVELVLAGKGLARDESPARVSHCPAHQAGRQSLRKGVHEKKIDISVQIKNINAQSGFSQVRDFQRRFLSIPDTIELNHLTVSGDVTFGRGVSLRGTVIIIANHGDRIDIPSGAILENKRSESVV